MKITELLTPITEVHWLSVDDTVGEAFDHLETYEVSSAPLLDVNHHYVGTVTEADLRRHVARMGRTKILAPTLANVERRSNNAGVTIDREVTSLLDQAAMHPFVPVVDHRGTLVGIVDRDRILDTELPRAA